MCGSVNVMETGNVDEFDIIVLTVSYVPYRYNDLRQDVFSSIIYGFLPTILQEIS